MNVNAVREEMAATAADAAQVSYQSQSQVALLKGVAAIKYLQGELLMAEADLFVYHLGSVPA